MPYDLGLKLYRSLLKNAREVEMKRMERYLIRSQTAKRKFSKELKDLVVNTLPDEGAFELVATIKELSRREPNYSMGFEACRCMRAVSTVDLNTPKIFDKGDVVQHLLGETGVVIGRQPACIMPQNWIEDTYGPHHPLVGQPWYEVVLDKHDGGFVTHTPGAFLQPTSCPIQSKLLQSEGWIFDDLQGRYLPPRDSWPPPI